MSRLQLILLAIFFITAPGVSVAQETETSRWGYHFGFSLTNANIKSVAATAQGIGDNPWGVQIGGGIWFFQILFLNVDVGLEWPGDHKKFEQSTTGGQRTSGVFMSSLSLSTGVQVPISLTKDPTGFQLVMGVNAGFENLSGLRLIDNCVDCDREDINLSDGTYWEPGLQLMAKETDASGIGIGVGISYRLYSKEADLDRRIIIKLILIGLF